MEAVSGNLIHTSFRDRAPRVRPVFHTGYLLVSTVSTTTYVPNRVLRRGMARHKLPTASDHLLAPSRYPSTGRFMDLLTCSAPVGRIEPAPLTSLVPEVASTDAWGAFWGEDDGYYVRQTTRDGAERWFNVGDSPLDQHASAARADSAAPVRARGGAKRVVFLFRAGARGGRVTSLAIRVGPSRRRR